jgi:hypothetical protein
MYYSFFIIILSFLLSNIHLLISFPQIITCFAYDKLVYLILSDNKSSICVVSSSTMNLDNSVIVVLKSRWYDHDCRLLVMSGSFLLAIISTQNLEPTQLSVQCDVGITFPRFSVVGL